MYQPRGDDDSEPETTWDEWFEQHYSVRAGGRRAWMLIFAVVMVLAMTGLYLSGNSAWFQP